MNGPGTILALGLALGLTSACGDDDRRGGDDDGSPDQVGSECETPDDCYPEVDPADIHGEVQCLDRVRAGYCTHLCAADEDCCAVEGECVTDLTQVCSPFESADDLMCFLSCEDADVTAAGAPDSETFCQENVSHDFTCRSSGGGSDNRKVCVPADCGVGAGCAEDVDCDPGLVCITSLHGGYCGVVDCAANADCPADSLCITNGNLAYCARTCAAETDCTLCRPADVAATCTADVEYVETGTTGTVCLPP